MDFTKIPEGSGDDGGKPAGTGADGQLVFHYSREERLKHAPQIVRDYYDGKIKAYRPGIFKALVATRANRMILFALAVCAAVVAFNAFFGGRPNRASVEGVPLELAAFSVEDRVYASVRADRAGRKSALYGRAAPVRAVFTGIDADGASVLTSEDSDLYEGRELFLRTTFTDFDILSVSADVTFVVDGEERRATLRSSVERR